MDPRDYLMLGLLLAVAVVGSAILVYVLRNLDKENGDEDSGGPDEGREE